MFGDLQNRSSSVDYHIYIYREDLVEFTALRFTAAGAPPAARRIQILPMNQPITFGMKGSCN
jgi:hypothetical protein